MKRLFFALDLNDTDKHTITLWREQHLSLTAKPVKSENLHITLAFLGMVEPEQQQTLMEFCDQQFLPQTSQPKKHFNIDCNQLALFKKAKALYLGCQHFPKPLIKLATLLSQQAIELGIIQESRQYHPHITIYRKAKSLPDNSKCQLDLTINSFSLYHSKSTPDGVSYIPLKTWSLVQK
ncbi:RNA 2',3'-cyclic phosphodiesterase [Thalassotalea insulae]|uniref:RNA 2',3'-cyclic phosphodiesterase n=1 Tax=Thalassotalea insulae TaxID=2056778 RepID=A0ABQ6GSU7_9GAMM|nr:RNA 2',3'-cyclic phosphodiesterase [Thalassotalea insulae]GLX79016.1 RNA 2',3'-cyclic phosphodiesterase [Thalassotalea insulae]